MAANADSLLEKSKWAARSAFNFVDFKKLAESDLGNDTYVQATTVFSVKADAPFIIGTVLLGLGLVGSLLVYLSLLCRRGKGFAGTRYYCFFLVTCNLLYLVAIIANNSSFPFTDMMASEVRKTFDSYKPAVIEWFNICYCWLTSFLCFETIIRLKYNYKGFPHAVWCFYGFAVTVLPGIYIALKFSIWKLQAWDPEPYTVFHLIGFIVMILTSVCMVVSALLLACCYKKFTSNSSHFSVVAFAGIFINGLITVWWQVPTGYDIGKSLIATRVDFTTIVEIVSSINEMVEVFNTTRDYAALSLSPVITWAMLLFMPGVSLFGIGHRTAVARVGSAEKRMTSA